MPEKTIVIKIHLRIEGNEISVLGDNQGIDFGKETVFFDKGSVKAHENASHFPNLGRIESKSITDFVDLKWSEA